MTAMNTEDYVSYPIAKQLKACGFDEPCIAQWACEPDGKPILLGSTAFVFSNAKLKGRDVTAPLLFHAQKWLRSKGIEVYVLLAAENDGYEWSIYDRNVRDNLDSSIADDYKTYEQALSAGISAALGLIKKRE